MAGGMRLRYDQALRRDFWACWGLLGKGKPRLSRSRVQRCVTMPLLPNTIRTWPQERHPGGSCCHQVCPRFLHHLSYASFEQSTSVCPRNTSLGAIHQDSHECRTRYYFWISSQPCIVGTTIHLHPWILCKRLKWLRPAIPHNLISDLGFSGTKSTVFSNVQLSALPTFSLNATVTHSNIPVHVHSTPPLECHKNPGAPSGPCNTGATAQRRGKAWPGCKSRYSSVPYPPGSIVPSRRKRDLSRTASHCD